MGFLYFLIALLLFLLLYTMISSLIKFTLYLTTRYKFEDYRLLLPTLFTMLLWALIVFGAIYVISNIFNIQILSILLNLLINAEIVTDDIINMVICILSAFVIGILLQSLTYFSININTKKIVSKIRFGFKKLFKIKSKNKNTTTNNSNNVEKEEIQNNEEIQKNNDLGNENVENNENIAPEDKQNNLEKNYVIIEEEIEKLDYSSAFAASLFTTCLILFLICLFFLFGYIASEEILTII